MARIVILNLSGKTLDVPPGAMDAKTMLGHFHDHHLDWMHSCGGKGRCTTCRVVIVEGMSNLQPPTEAELKYRRQGLLKTNERLTCQAKIAGDIVISVPDDCKLPHIHYSD